MSRSGRIYLDHNATAPLVPEARDAMVAALDLTGNASSVHGEGRRAREVVEAARADVAVLVGAMPSEVVFTSGATEANVWAIRAGGWSRVIVGATEHPSVLEPAHGLDGSVDVVACPASGVVDTAELDAALGAGGTTLVSVQRANSETGVLQPIDEIVGMARSAGAVVHSDVVQAVGRVSFDFAGTGLDLASMTAHKIGGPKGIGALLIRDGVALPVLMCGGGQERRRRAGTENVAAIAGFGAAARVARARLAEAGGVTALRDRLEAGVADITPDAVIIGAGAPRIGNTSCIAVPGADAATLLIKLDLAGIAVSAGSACSSGRIGGSHVMAALGLPKALADAAIRISLGPTTTRAEIDQFLAAWAAIHRARASVSSSSTASGARRAAAAAGA